MRFLDTMLWPRNVQRSHSVVVCCSIHECSHFFLDPFNTDGDPARGLKQGIQNDLKTLTTHHQLKYSELQIGNMSQLQYREHSQSSLTAVR